MTRKRFKIGVAALVMLFAVTSAPGMASAAVTKRSLTPDRVFQFDPPAGKQVIQTFDNGAGTDVYFTQRVDADTRLSRCLRTTNGTCTQQDSVRLPGFGHGESLEVYTEGGKTYAWVGSKSNGVAPHHFSSEISLIEYVKAPAGSKTATYNLVGTLTDLKTVDPRFTSGAGLRSAVALADGSNRLGLRVQTTAAGDDNFYSIYKTAELTARLKATPGKRLAIAKASDLRVSQFKEPGRPHKSFQGFDIKGVGTDNKFLYVFGGGMGQSPTIYRFSYTNGGTVTQDREYEIKGATIGLFEAEGIKVEADPTNGGKEMVQHSLNPDVEKFPDLVDAGGTKKFRLYHFAE